VLTPLVDVVMASRNGSEFIGRAIASVQSQDVPCRTIVVDDGSVDNAAEIARGCGAHVVRLPPSGQPAALNAGVAIASAPWLTFLDDDDLLTVGSISRRIAIAESREMDAVYGAMTRFRGEEPGASEVVPGNRAGRLPGTMLVRRREFLRVGSFEPGLAIGFFIEWLDRAETAGLRWTVTGYVVLLRRMRQGSLSTDPNYSRSLLSVLALVRRRRRAQS
jgi:glycosyltransferase involved in cell wall biosynthesis